MFENKELPCPGYFLCYYIPAKKDTTILSSLLLDFKSGITTGVIDDISNWACSEFLQRDVKVDLIIRALHSNEIEATLQTPLDTFCHILAVNLKAQYFPLILKKSRLTYPLKKIELGKRKAEVENVYYLDCKNLSDEISILIIDDIYTTGATMNEIIRSIKSVNPLVLIYFFTLGKTVFEPNRNKSVLTPESFYKYETRYPDCFEDMVVEYK